MKKVIILSVLFLCGLTRAQVGIDKSTLRSSSSIMEFNDVKEANGEAKGIILPILQDSGYAKEGALWLDANTKKVMYKSESGEVELTKASTQEIYLPTLEEVGEGVIISDGSLSDFTNDPAVLKLDSNQKALLLPHVNDVTKDISNPEPGTIVYDVKSKSLAIFNGEHWYFWN
ncbi:hypothetical protein KRX57_00285 [Weeksellaceae bacterium TAE3-ERU29]|nr:hypothetical protein [Weeksellaceae bacterium TAE3-ERU29]